MKRFKNIHRGKRAFIACNGPSLNDVDVTKLKGEIVFVLNRGYLKKGLPITYLVVVNDLVEKQFAKELLAVKCKAYFSNGLSGPRVYRLRWTPNIPKFTGDPTQLMWQGHTVTYSAMQIAFFMGIKKLYLVGCDHSFDYSTARRDGKRGVVTTTKDLSHFDPNYWGKGVRWDPYPLKSAAKAYHLAYKGFKKAGRILANASSVTALSEDVLPRVDFDSLFG